MTTTRRALLIGPKGTKVALKWDLGRAADGLLMLMDGYGVHSVATRKATHETTLYHVLQRIIQRNTPKPN